VAVLTAYALANRMADDSADPDSKGRVLQLHSARSVYRKHEEAEAFLAELYGRMFPPLMTMARRIVGDDAEDTVHDAFVRLWRNVARDGKPPENAEGLLVVLVRAAIADHVRREARLTGRLRRFYRRTRALTAPADSAARDTERREEYEALSRHVEQLSPRERELWQLIVHSEYTYKQAAAAMEIRPATVRVLISRAVERLAKALAAEGHETREGKR
jgi:RNA polymerase sigma-70 factor (ECF subfamily)